MSSLRKKLDEGNLTPGDIEFFKRNKGSIPLCCSEMIFVDKRTDKSYEDGPMCKCDQLEHPIPFLEFKEFCLKCQRYIEEQLEKKK